MTPAGFTELPPHAPVRPEELGEFVVLPGTGQHSDPGARERLRQLVASQPQVDLIYADERSCPGPQEGWDGDGPARALTRPDWAPEWLRHLQYPGDWCVLRTELALAVAVPDRLTDPAWRYDLLLRAGEQARTVAHVAEPLAHRRLAPGECLELPASQRLPGARERSVLALQQHLDRVGIRAHAAATGEIGRYDIVREPLAASVAIVVPTRGSRGHVWGAGRCFVVEAVRAAVRRTSHRDLEVIVVADTTTPADVLAELTSLDPRVVIRPYDEPFNFARKCNLAVAESDADVIVLLNDDTEAITDGWLERLIAPLAEDDVGLVGPRLLFADGSIQQAGHVYTRLWTHAYAGYPADHRGELAALRIDHEYSGATAACVAMRREVYERAGGLREELAINFNDVDLCLKIGQLGYRILCLAGCELYHFESRTRTPVLAAEELAAMTTRWLGTGWPRDPYLPWDSARTPYGGSVPQ